MAPRERSVVLRERLPVRPEGPPRARPGGRSPLAVRSPLAARSLLAVRSLLAARSPLAARKKQAIPGQVRRPEREFAAWAQYPGAEPAARRPPTASDRYMPPCSDASFHGAFLPLGPCVGPKLTEPVLPLGSGKPERVAQDEYSLQSNPLLACLKASDRGFPNTPRGWPGGQARVCATIARLARCSRSVALATTCPVWRFCGAPSGVVTIPPASRTRRIPAATSHTLVENE